MKRFELWIIWGVAGVGLALSLLDLFGVLERVPFFENKIAPILLAVLSACLCLLANIWQRLDDNSKEIAALRQTVAQDTLTSLRSLPDHLPTEFGRLAGEAARDLVRQAEDLFNRHTFKLVGAEPFRLFYAQVLRQLPKAAVVHATSLPSRQYFWRSAPVDQAIRDFIQGGGTMKRLFFVSPAELADPECAAVLDRQAKLGVQVFVCDPADAPSGIIRLIFLIDDSPFGWEVRTTHRGETIHEVVVSADPQTVKGYADAVQTIRHLCSPRAYDGSDAVF